MNLPESYVLKMRELLKDEFEGYMKSFEEKPYVGLRANTLKIGADKLKELLDFKLDEVAWCKEGFYYGDDVRPAKSPYYHAGLFYIQEPSAMSAAGLLPIEENDRVLDLCAAPGGKSTQIAAKLNNTGVLVSNDISASRCKALLKNIEISGIRNAIVTNEPPDKLAKKFEGFFNKIIIDAPCSGEGMFRKDIETLKNWDESKAEMFCQMQRDILKYADEMLCDGGMIAYSTCTFDPNENEGSINEFLNNHSNYEILDIADEFGFSKGMPSWIENGNAELEKCARLWPQKIKGEGHFLALLRKKGEVAFREIPKMTPYKDAKNLEDYFSFMKEHINFDINENLYLHETSLIQVPLGIDLKGLRIVRSGWKLGEIKTKRFEPSQAFAMGLTKEDVKFKIEFKNTDDRVIRYLKGESFTVEAEDGWNLVLVDGFPLGWGKVQKGRLKNKYFTGWRICN